METKIERYETITVETVVKDEKYNKLIVNGKYKISEKRQNLWEVFQIGAEVNLGWANFKNQDFIASAEQIHKDSPLVKAALNMGAEKVREPANDKYPHEKPVQPSPDATKSNSKPVTPPISTNTPAEVMTPEKWDAKEARTRKSIERQKALEIAASLQIEQTNHPDKIIMVAKKFERYLETGE